MVLNHIYYSRNDKGGKDYFPPDQVAPMLDAQGHISGGRLADGTELHYGGVGKMGKTERNGVDPQDMIEKYGADTSRLYMMFTAPPEASLEWNDSAVEGSWKFLRRVWTVGRLADASIIAANNSAPQPNITGLSAQQKLCQRDFHVVLGQVNFDYERVQYNTVVSGCMKMLNIFEKLGTAGIHDGDDESFKAAVFLSANLYGILLRVLYPVCPHITQILWKELGYAGEILNAPWPEVDPTALISDTVELVLQINGKTRGSVTVASSADKATIEATAEASPEVAKFGEGRAPKKIIVVPGRLVNVVV